jgi:hypothetical protein
MSKEIVLSVKAASKWASAQFEREILPAHISYLIQYGQVRKVVTEGALGVYQDDLLTYYAARSAQEAEWKKKLGDDLNWALSFDDIREKERTKHVHRLHPYKGKFIPQLVEYFLDNHTDEFKKQSFFSKGDIVLDPFCGSGTTLVQANALSINAVGIDVSKFNALISNVKISDTNLASLEAEILKITRTLGVFVSETHWPNFEKELLSKLKDFNSQYFPSPDYRYKVRHNEIDEKPYSIEKEAEFLEIFKQVAAKYDFEFIEGGQRETSSFLDKWYLEPVRKEIDYTKSLIDEVQNLEIRRIITIILSRTIRSCRATTHADLATLKEPVSSTYYCRKHYKLCKPKFSILGWWKRYSKDTIKRLSEFKKIRTDTQQLCLTGDSRSIDILSELSKQNPLLANLAKKQKIRGVFSSPPYVGLIDYHEQHAYAYDLFGFQRRDDLEIGPLFTGKGQKAKDSYVMGISEVLANSQKFLADDFDIFLVANDQFGLYERIAKEAGLVIYDEYKRPVLNRTEKNRSAYSETIFHMKKK